MLAVPLLQTTHGGRLRRRITMRQQPTHMRPLTQQRRGRQATRVTTTTSGLRRRLIIMRRLWQLPVPTALGTPTRQQRIMAAHQAQALHRLERSMVAAVLRRAMGIVGIMMTVAVAARRSALQRRHWWLLRLEATATAIHPGRQLHQQRRQLFLVRQQQRQQSRKLRPNRLPAPVHWQQQGHWHRQQGARFHAAGLQGRRGDGNVLDQGSIPCVRPYAGLLSLALRLRQGGLLYLYAAMQFQLQRWRACVRLAAGSERLQLRVCSPPLAASCQWFAGPALKLTLADTVVIE